jgi:hypothetical protein
MFSGDHLAARGAVSNAYSADVNNSIVGDAKVMEPRRLKVLDVNMDSTPFFSRDLAIYVVDEAAVDVNVIEQTFRVVGEHVNAKQNPLIAVCPVCIRYFETVNFPERGIFEKESRLVRSVRVDCWEIAFTVGIDENRLAFATVSFGAKHAREAGSSLEKNGITGLEGLGLQTVKHFLRINEVFCGLNELTA